MSLKDDLLRNRKVFELLTASDTAVSDFGAASDTVLRKSAPAVKALDFRIQEPVRQSFRVQEDAPQKAEIFSLKTGSRIIRENGVSMRPAAIEAIEFPRLNRTNVPPAADPIEGLYHRLETESRRTSQLLHEEEY